MIYGVNSDPWKLIIAATDETVKQVTEFCNLTNSGVKEIDVPAIEFVDPDNPSILYIATHGSSDGKFVYKGRMVDGETYLKENKERLQEMGVRTVLTICCHGGIQKKVRYNGILFGPVLNSPFKAYVEANPIALMTRGGVVVSALLPNQKHPRLKIAAMKIWSWIERHTKTKELK